jgi:hypothetical protein
VRKMRRDAAGLLEALLEVVVPARRIDEPVAARVATK